MTDLLYGGLIRLHLLHHVAARPLYGLAMKGTSFGHPVSKPHRIGLVQPDPDAEPDRPRSA
jgi:hypothetical protein